MISHKHEVIFIHIPKTAGSSITKKFGLLEDEGRDHRTIRNIRPIQLPEHLSILLNKQECRRHNVSRKEVVKTKLGLEKDIGRLNKNKFRNYFKFTIIRNPWDRVYSWYKNVMRDPQHGIPQCEFENFLKEYGENWAMKPQTYWIEDFDGSIPLDRIVRFENLNKEMEYVLGELGFEDKTLPEVLKTEGKNKYLENYNKTTYEIVEKRYEKEIEMFGYG